MRPIVFVVLAALMTGGTFPAEEQKPQAALAVRIVSAERNRGDGPQLITLHQPSQHFHVVVTNVSDTPVRLWREWCSWGYYTLSFRITDENGQTTELKKGPHQWAKNYADWTLLQPGDHMVYEVSFDKETWPDGMFEKEKLYQVKMRAVIEVKADAETAREGIWTGTVLSPEQAYRIAR